LLIFRRADRDPSKEVWGPQGAQAVDAKKLERFKNGFVNLALPQFAFSEPLPARRHILQGREWTLWDRFDINEDMTLKQLLDYFKSTYNLEVDMLAHGISMLYVTYMAPAEKEELLDLSISELVRCRVSKKTIKSYMRALELDIYYKDDQARVVKVPYIRYQLPPN
jgi:ubiquitin-activating enzyme E1